MRLGKMIVSLVLTFVLLFTSVSSHALGKEVNDLQRFELENGIIASLKEEENERIRTFSYYENEELLQIAVLDKLTEYIYLFDFENGSTYNNKFKSSNSIAKNLQSLTHTAKYHINDFKVQHDGKIITSDQDSNGIQYGTTNSGESLVDTAYFVIDGVTHYRMLYGYTDVNHYRANNWAFAVGTAISVVSAVLSVISFTNPVAKIIGLGLSVGGIVVSNFSVQHWVKDHFWKYRFLQSNPTHIEFYVPYEYVYKTEEKIEIDGDTGYWETTYTQPYYEIAYRRSHILEYPGLYF